MQRTSILSGMLLFVAVGCGEVTNQLDASSGSLSDAASVADAAAAGDGAPTRRCDPTAPFGAGTAVSELNEAGDAALDEYARLSPDELTVYFSSTRLGDFDILFATRSDPAASFGKPAALPGVNTGATERVPALTGDGLWIVATRQFEVSPDVFQFRVVGAIRPDVESDFGSLEVLANVNTLDFEDTDPYVLAGGSALYFASKRPLGEGDDRQDSDLYRSPREGAGFGSPVPVGGEALNRDSVEEAPVVTEDELTIYFSSDRAKVATLDIYTATRASMSEAFGPPEPIDILNSNENLEWPTWISPDGCLLYYSKSNGTANVGYDIYMAARGQ